MPAEFKTEPATEEATSLPAVKKKRKLPKWLKVIGVAVILVGAIAFGMLRFAQKAVEGAIFYQPVVAEMGDIAVKVSKSATVQPADSYTVTALVTGEVLDAPFEEGQLIEKDTPLFSIDSGDLDYQIERAELGLRQAQLQLDNVRLSTTPMTTASGRVKAYLVEVGDSVAPGTPIATVIAGDQMTLTLPFHATDVALFSLGQSATVTLDSTMEQLTGTITDIGWDDVAGAGGAILRTVEISLDNPGGLSTANVATATVGACGSVSSAPLAEGKLRTVTATTSGTITALLASGGDWVGADAPLCRIGGNSVNTSIENAEIAVKNAESTLNSTLDMLDNYNITAPISGTIIEKKVKAGDNIEPTTGPLAILYDMSYLEFTMNIDELDIGKLAVGQKVNITSEAVPDGTFTGIVDKISINGLTLNGVTTYPVTILVDDAGALLPGMNVSADIMVEEVKDVLIIPVEAVARDNTVQVLPAEGGLDEAGNVLADKLQTVTVELGRNDQDNIEIISGLSAGQTVVITSVASNIMEQMMGMSGGSGMSVPPMAGALGKG